MAVSGGTDPAAPGTGYRFGTFKGVFTPSILTVLGVVMYLRLGWVLGQVGLWLTLLIVIMSSAITFITGLSLAALATNMRVRLGGAYFIISRSLGIEAGAAIGVPLFLAQAVGIAFYLIGFAESVNALSPALDPQLVAVLALAVLALVAALSADLALRTQYLVMALIAASLSSFFLGAGSPSPPPVAPDSVPVGAPFWLVFAVFFPAVTGIEAGLSMSGDLKNPARSLPLGTLAAVGVGFIIYMAIPIVFHLSGIEREALISDPMAMQRVARWPALIAAGIWAGALSSAMGAMLGAPRTLQALARDRVVFRFLGRGFGAGGDPRIASVVAFSIALAAILLGDLNQIAPVLSMFFLTSYGLLNLSAGLETLISPASWRPRLKLRAAFPLAGFFGCVAVMLMIDAGATLIAWTVAGGIYYLMKRRSIRAGWGDLRRGLLLMLVRRALYTLARLPAEARTWQPNILVLSGLPSRRWHLVELANAICEGRGLLSLAFVVPRAGFDRDRQAAIRTTISRHLQKQGVESLVCIYPHDDMLTGALHLVQTYGLGPLVPNTLLLGQSKLPENTERFGAIVRTAYDTHKNIIIVREADEDTGTDTPFEHLPVPDAGPETAEGTPRQIDIWWGAKSPNRDLMLALTVLLQRSPDWANARVNIRMVVESDAAREETLAAIKTNLDSERVEADPQVIISDERDIFRTITDGSADADLVLLGIRPPAEGESDDAYGRYCYSICERSSGLALAALVLTGEPVPFSQLFATGDAVPHP